MSLEQVIKLLAETYEVNDDVKNVIFTFYTVDEAFPPPKADVIVIVDGETPASDYLICMYEEGAFWHYEETDVEVEGVTHWALIYDPLKSVGLISD